MSKVFSEVPGHPDAVKQELKEKEALKEKDKEKDKEHTKETKDKHDKSEKHEKEKSEKDAKDKDHKDNKDQKEAKEHKEQKDHKDQKDKPEKEHKDKLHHKDKAEPKEVLKEKEANKDKEVHKDEEVQAAAKTFDKFRPEKFHKDFDKVRKDTEKGNPDKSHIEAAQQLHKFHGKEHIEKTHKDTPDKLTNLEFLGSVAEEPQAAAAHAGFKIAEKVAEKLHAEKFHKEFKVEKFEKQEKFEKFEKIEIKEWEFQPGSIDPGGPVEQRLAAIEATLSQLVHFIPANLRPDLTTGALVQEEAEKKPAGGKAKRPARKRKAKP
jgi:hypothetical protein